MKKCFNNVQMFKSSEDCDKYSKSVSYETLVGGTTTIGRDRKQTQRLCEYCADKPLTAVGTLTSLLCNSAKVVEKIFYRHSEPKAKNPKKTGTVMPDLIGHLSRIKKEAVEVAFGAASQAPCLGSRLLSCPRMTILWILRFANASLVMTIPVLALLFTLITTGESRAEDCKNSSGQKVTCIDKLTDENGNNSCGNNCTYKVIVENGKQVLHVYKKDISKPATIRDGAFSPKFYAGNQVLDASGKALPLNNIVLDNDFENIRSYAFAESGAQISSASGKFIVNNTGSYAFLNGSNGRVTMNADVLFNKEGHYVFQGANINGDVIISDGVTAMGVYALGVTRIDGNIIIPQSVERIHLDSLFLDSLTGQIYCASGIENCYNMIIAGCSEIAGRTECFNSAKNLLDFKKFSAYPDGCEKLEANLKCTKCKSASFKLEDDGWCLRKIYTPAEAAEVLRDDNTNEVTITFKK